MRTRMCLKLTELSSNLGTQRQPLPMYRVKALAIGVLA
jgi:hypothetical protein